MSAGKLWKAQSQHSKVDYLVASTDNERDGYLWFKTFITDPGREYTKKTGHVAVKEFYYKGFAGLEFDGIKVGANKTHWLLWASGDNANSTFPYVAPTAKKVARIDLAVTVNYNEESKGQIEKYYKQAQQDPDKRRISSFIQNSESGETLYVGSFNSSQFGRIYYKDVEANLGTVGKVVRYEVVLRDKISTAIRDEMLHHGRENQDLHIASFVMDWFKSRGVIPVYKSQLPRYSVKIQKQVTSTDRKLNWLKSQVRPTILSLLEQGYQEELQSVLGIEISQLMTQATLPF